MRNCKRHQKYPLKFSRPPVYSIAFYMQFPVKIKITKKPTNKHEQGWDFLLSCGSLFCGGCGRLTAASESCGSRLRWTESQWEHLPWKGSAYLTASLSATPVPASANETTAARLWISNMLTASSYQSLENLISESCWCHWKWGTW